MVFKAMTPDVTETKKRRSPRTRSWGAPTLRDWKLGATNQRDRKSGQFRRRKTRRAEYVGVKGSLQMKGVIDWVKFG